MFSFVQAFFTIFLTAIAVDALGNKDLVAVVQLFRHGHRTPIEFYANDWYSNKSFWDGLDLGQLTNAGKRQHYALGQLTRGIYADWLPLSYNRADFYAQTTDVDRTHMSGQANMYGLYPAADDQQWLPHLNWQPIPLHPPNSSYVFNTIPSTACIKYYTELESVLNGEAVQKIDSENAELYSYLTEKSGDNVTNLSTATVIWDCLKSEDDYGLTLPNWASAVYPQPLKDTVGNFYQLLSNTTLLKRLVVGPYLNSIVEYFEEMAKNSSYSQKYQMYSAHDINIANVLNSFGAFDPPYPPAFASSLYMELRQKDGSFFVNVWSKNLDSLKQISIKGCELDCPLSEVRERLSDVLIDVDTLLSECSATELKNMIPSEKSKQMKDIEKIKYQYDH